jgi:hypothetical protein
LAGHGPDGHLALQRHLEGKDMVAPLGGKQSAVFRCRERACAIAWFVF